MQEKEKKEQTEMLEAACSMYICVKCISVRADECMSILLLRYPGNLLALFKSVLFCLWKRGYKRCPCGEEELSG